MLTTYEVIITRYTTESAVVHVLAHDREEASERATDLAAHQASALTWTKDDNAPSHAYFGGSVEDIEEVDGVVPTPVEPTEDSPLYVATFTPAAQDAEIKRALNTAIECGVLAGFKGLADNIARTAGIKPADPDEGALPGRTGPRFLTVEIDRLSKVADMLEEANANDEDPDAFAARLAAAREPIPVPAAELGEDEPVHDRTVELDLNQTGDDVAMSIELETLRGQLITCERLITRWSEALYPVGLHGWAVDPTRLAPLSRDTRNIAKAIANEKRK